MSQLSDKVLISRYFWATCPHSDELPATSWLIFYKKDVRSAQKFRWPGGINVRRFVKIPRFAGFPAHCGLPRWFCSWTHDGEIRENLENTENTGKCWKVGQKGPQFGTFGELSVIQMTSRRILQSFFYKKSLSLEPSRNHVVLGVRV